MGKPDISRYDATARLEELGLRVQQIPEAPPAKRADLRCFDQLGQEYVVEAKHRDPHSEWQPFFEAALSNPGATLERTYGPWGAVDKRITDAAEQLAATPSGPEALRVLWVSALRGDESFVHGSYERQLLGVEPLTVFAGLEAEQPIDMKDCYHYRRSGFRRYAHIDCAVLSSVAGGRLLVNAFSPSAARLRGSHLFHVFAERGAVVDPVTEIAAGTALMLGADFPGTYGEDQQWEYLRDRFGVLTSVGTDVQCEGMLRIPANTLRDKEAFD